MHQDDFLTGCANTLELSIKGQQLLAQDVACAIRRMWRRLVGTTGDIAMDRPPAA